MICWTTATLTCGWLHAQSADQPVAAELVGKWCFMNVVTTTADTPTNSCITLNADGTYEATIDRSTLPQGNALPAFPDTDSGRWWVRGNRLFYQSGSKGDGSYFFQKVNHPRSPDVPMVVINGITFVTASSHGAW